MRPEAWLPSRLQHGVLALLLGSATVAFPQSRAPIVSEQDIKNATRISPAITEADLERARRAHRSPTDAALSRAPLPSTPDIDALPRPASQGPIDLEALANGYASAVRESVVRSGLAAGPGLLVFVSFTMPDRTLTRLVDQAARAKATLVLRGLVNGSLQETVGRVQQLLQGRTVAVQIDPQSYERFAVSVVPTFVLVHDGARPADCAAGSCYPPDTFVAVAGDVSLDYALEQVQRKAPPFTKEAAGFLKRLRG